MRYAGTVNAPPFPAGLDWLNSPGPLRLEDFAGRLLVLDFWTLCCINCMHVLPVLARLERRFPDELAVVGVHSAKFPHERESTVIADAIARYGVRHPVVNDALQAVWRSYTVRAWPTLMFVDPAGRVIGRVEGELSEADGWWRREIVTFREGDGGWRRGQEVHFQRLRMVEEVELALRDAGFASVEVSDRYGALALPPGRRCFTARR